jgi:1,6-anhydro-N-acetylmuramate kinase
MNTPSSALPSQKLVTIYLDNMAYAPKKLLLGGYADKHGLVEEHLGEFLAQGWRVAEIHNFGSAGEQLGARGWITVLLEKPASS